MADKLTNQQKKEWAKTLYLKENITTQKELAAKVGVNPNTVGRWIKDENWESLRKNILITRAEQLQNLYSELEQMNNYIKTKPEGRQFADSKEADARRKLITDIKDLETKASVAEVVETSQRVVRWLAVSDLEKAKEVSMIFDAFIKEQLR